ncbi:hypothetical protein BHE74_00057367 [Ensete ventricosum]|nr:hypothetical protein BHE74_00057367 [Ensete ventricosum]
MAVAWMWRSCSSENVAAGEIESLRRRHPSLLCHQNSFSSGSAVPRHQLPRSPHRNCHHCSASPSPSHFGLQPTHRIKSSSKQSLKQFFASSYRVMAGLAGVGAEEEGMIGGGGVEPGSEYSAASGPPATAGPQADDRLISVHFSPKDLGPSLSLWAVVRPRWRPNRRSEWWKRRDGGRLGEGPPSPSGWVPKGTASGKEGQ